jgi:competence protein ComEA
MRKTLLSSALMAMLATIPFATQAAVSDTTTPAGTASMPIKADMATKNDMAVHSDTVNLNTADAATLQKELAGIGAAKAKAIVAFREQNGAFTSVEELLEVDGIGKALLDRNRDRLAVN